MKKALTLVVLIVAPTMAFAQGMVSFGNQTGLVRQWSMDGFIPVPKGGGYVQLFAAPIGTALLNPLIPAPGAYPNYDYMAAFLGANPGWSAAVNNNGAVPAAIALGNGLFNGGAYTINGIGLAANAQYLVLGWTGAFTDSTSALTAYAGSATFMGESAIFTTTTADPAATPPATPVLIRTTFGGMTLWPCTPEPSTFALVGLGAVMLMIFGRRR